MLLLKQKRIVIIGGTSGIGLATAKLALRSGAELVVTGLHQETLSFAQRELGENASVFTLDINDEQAVKAFFQKIGEFDYLTTPGSSIPKGPFLTMETAEARTGFDSKFWGQYNAAKYAVPYLRREGAIVFFSGVVSQRPQKNLVVMAAVNSAIEGLGRALAVELAPLRVNVIAPGIVDTPRYASMDPETRQKMFAQLANQLPVGHAGQPEELAEAVLYLMTNTFMTGQTLYVDGGHLLT